MSTRIYNGWLVKKPSLEAVLKELADLKPAAILHAQTLALKFVAREAAYMADMTSLGVAQPEPKSSLSVPLYRAMDELVQRQREVRNTQRRDSDVDFSLSVVVFPPLKSRVGQQLLAMSFCENVEMGKLWSELSFVKEFGYWDNTDPPEDIPAVQWKARKRAWDRVMPSGVPSDHGFSFELAPEVIDWDLNADKLRDLALSQIPDLQSRARRVARELVGLECEQAGLSMSKTIARLRDPSLDERAEELSQRLKPELTYEDLVRRG